MKTSKKGFREKLEARRQAAPPGSPPCECWDCLREAGLTPPLSLRHAHKTHFPKPSHEVRGHGVDIPGKINHKALIKGEKEVTESTEAEDKLAAVRV